jgi:hypothetical protein
MVQTVMSMVIWFEPLWIGWLGDGICRHGFCRKLLGSFVCWLILRHGSQTSKQQGVSEVLSQILLEFECGHRPDIIMLRAPQTAETR